MQRGIYRRLNCVLCYLAVFKPCGVLSGDSLKAPNATNTFTLDSTSARLESADTNNLVTKYIRKFHDFSGRR